MRPRAHLAAGAIIGALSASDASERPGSLPAPASISYCALAANLPDLDLFLPALSEQLGLDPEWPALHPRAGHHDWITHTPALWLAVGAASAAAASVSGSARATELARLTSVCVLTHLAQDFLVDRIPAMWPLTDARSGLRLGRLPRGARTETRQKARRERPAGSGPLLASLARSAADIRSDAREWNALYRRTQAARVEGAIIAVALAAVALRLCSRSRDGG